VIEGMQGLLTAKSGAVVALGNEKATLAGRITALENDAKTEKTRADQAATALANEQTARKTERTGRAEATTDLAIHRGILTIAERDGQVTALSNSADFAADATALLKRTPTRKTTTNGLAESGKQGAALDNEQAQTRALYNSAFEKELPLAGQDPVKAHAAIMQKPEYAGLAQKLLPKTPGQYPVTSNQ
jgi:hypothetical protein